MVTILKKPKGESKGVLVFTHKERYIFGLNVNILQRLLKYIDKKYICGMHWGFFQATNQYVDYIDFHLATSSAVTFDNRSNSKIIDLTSRNFIPEYFKPNSNPPIYDILYVGRLSKVKRINELVNVLRSLQRRGTEFSALILVNGPAKVGALDSTTDTKAMNQYGNFIEASENIKFVYQNNRFDFLPHELLNQVYNHAKCLTLFTQREGESRVIHEALMCGTPVVVREDLRGGGRDYLDETNSFQFNGHDEAVQIFSEIAESDDVGFDPGYLRKSLSAEYTTKKFESEIRAVFDSLGEPYEGSLDTENLEFKLPGHVSTLPDGMGSHRSNDLRNLMEFYRFVQYATGLELPGGYWFKTRLFVTDLMSVRVPRRVKAWGEIVIRMADERVPFPLYEKSWQLFHNLRSRI